MKRLLLQLINNRFTGFFFATRKRGIFTIILIVAIAGWRISAFRSSGLEIGLARVERTELIESISAPGEIKAENIADLVNLSAGEIQEVYVEDGAGVKKGDKIAKINTNILYQDYHRKEAALRDAEATLAKVYDDVKGHDKDETLTQKKDRTAAEAAKDIAYRSFVIAQQNLSNGNLVAPFDGIVNFGEKASSGSYSSVTSSSFTVVDPSTTYFEAKVNEVDIVNIKKGMKALIELDAYPDSKFVEKVKMIGFISTTTSSGGTAYKVRVTLSENTNNKFRLGMNGDVEFVINRENSTLTIPTTAIVEEDDKTYVWTVNGVNKAKRIEVSTGKSSIDSTEILSGLSEGDEIIERPPSKIEEGIRVKEKENE